MWNTIQSLFMGVENYHVIEFVVELSSVKVAKERRKFTDQIYSTLDIGLRISK
ncbi:hypothetical protein Hanom_Chr17g01542901 [Helianthus anomalus]